MTEDFRKSFAELKVTGQRSEVSETEKGVRDRRLIDFLTEALKSGELQSFEDVGFAYWNISDSYALLKTPTELYENHLVFYGSVKPKDPKYLWWTVSDATQKLTLEAGGHGEFWWALYNQACLRSPDPREHFAEFSAHRAAMYMTAAAPYDEHDLETAKYNFERFLGGIGDCPEHTFYKTVYLSLTARLGKAEKKAILPLFEPMLSGLSLPKEPRRFLPGEWQGLITPPCKRRQSELGINAVINALISLEETHTARQLYQEARRIGLPQNKFVERLIL